MEEGIRFERMVGRPTAVFKTAGLNHSPNPPKYGRRESNPQRADFKSDASAVPPLPPKALGGGIEPPTYALTVRRSTTELPQNKEGHCSLVLAFICHAPTPSVAR